MSGITSGVGVFSGIDSRSIIDQLIQIEARPRTLAQRRVAQLQTQQAVYLDLNSRVSAFKTAAAKFRVSQTFRSKVADSSDPAVLTASASNTAAPGSYTFRVDRLVTTQQMLSRGFADRNTTAVGASSFTFESAQARLDSSVMLSDLNDGAGIARGTIVITDSGSRNATIDLSRATSVQDVLDAINNNSTARVKASLQDGKFVIRDNANGAVTVANGSGYTTAESLGIAGTATGTLTGTRVYGLNANTTLGAINDGNGVSIRPSTNNASYSFAINVNGTAVNVNLGDVYDSTNTKTAGAVSNVGQVVDRINTALSGAGFSGVSARINADVGRIELVGPGGTTYSFTENGGTTARDLGLTNTGLTGTFNGRSILAGMGTVLNNSLNGGAGIDGDGQISFTTRDGSSFSLNLDASDGSLTSIMQAIEQASGTTGTGQPRVSVSLNRQGTGLLITDNTAGTGNLFITGTDGADTAASLGIATAPTGVASSTVTGRSLQKRYFSEGTQLSTLNGGKGIGTGKIRLFDGSGASALVDIGEDAKTVNDLISEINAAMVTGNVSVRARINANGDGMEIYDTGTGSVRIKVEDDTGNVAKNLGIRGAATGTGTGAANRLDGSQERTVTFAAGDTLDTVVRKINEAGVGVDAAVVRDGAGSTPFRLSMTSERSGRVGRFVLDTNGFDLGVRSLAAGDDAVAFFGAGDVANAIAVVSSSNQVDGILPGVKIDLKSPSSAPVNVNVTQDTETIEKTVSDFVSAFNDLVGRIDEVTRYDSETQARGPLLGDGTIIELKNQLYSVLNQRVSGFSTQYDQLVDVGLKVGNDGKMEFNADKFREAMAADPQAVEALFARRVAVNDSTTTLGPGVTVNNPNSGNSFSELGVMAKIEQLTDRYTNSISGVLTRRQRGLDDQVQSQNRRIEAITARLDQRRSILERQFASMESTIGRLQGQQSSLTTLAQAAAAAGR
jgi:flagellar hook-associated protein 2